MTATESHVVCGEDLSTRARRPTHDMFRARARIVPTTKTLNGKTFQFRFVASTECSEHFV